MLTKENESHAADESAGGEIVLSSDGMSPLPKPNVIPTLPSIANNNNNNNNMSVLDTSHLEASEAFEVFAGKLYPTTTTTATTAPSTTTTTESKKKETPLQRLARLQDEVKQLEQDLQQTGSNEDDNEGIAKAIPAIVEDLKLRLSHASKQQSASQTQDDLTQFIQQQIKQYEEQQIGTTKSDGGGDAANPPPSSGIVYELYAGGSGSSDASAAAASSSVDPSSVTSRLIQLEKVLGTSTTSSSKKNVSILQRIEDMEILMSNLDESSLESASMKAKVIRSDLEAANKARNKLNAVMPTVSSSGNLGLLNTPGGASNTVPATPGGSSSASLVNRQNYDAKMISSLYDQLIGLDGLSEHLPALVQRLKQLAILHGHTSNFTSRLTESEKQVQDLNIVMSSIEKTLSQVENNITTNFNTIQNNIQSLDEKINK